MMRTWLIGQSGRWQIGKVSACLALLAACYGVSVAQEKKDACSDEVKYENYNQIDPPALTVCDVKGQVADMNGAPMPGACLSVYTETDHKLIASTTSDEDGNYKFDKIRPGQYRLVVSYYPFCAANAKIIIAANCPRSIKYKSVYVHMRLRGIDECSYANHTRPRIENSP
jgi:carboxypeptidase family protein